MPALAVELLQVIAEYIVGDLKDTDTIKACSLSFPHFTRYFQRALCSKKATTFSFYVGMEKNKREYKVIANLIKILKEDPSFGACITQVRLSLQTSDFLDNASICQIFAHLTEVENLTLRVNRGIGDWTQVTNYNRRAIEGVIHSPSLKTLTLSSLKVPWSTFLGPRPTLDKLVLVYTTDSASENVSINEDTKPSFITAIQSLDAGPNELAYLLDAKRLDDPGTHPIDFPQLRKLSTNLRRSSDVLEVRNMLHHATHLEHLILSCSYSDLKGLFYAPHSPSLYRLQTLELSSEYIFRVSFLHTIADELRFLPKGNGIKRIKIGRVSFPGYAEGVRDWRKNESDWRALLDPLTPEAFPSLKTVSIDAHVTIVNGCSGPGTDRMLQDLHQLEVDFGDEGRHYVFKMFAREKHVFV